MPKDAGPNGADGHAEIVDAEIVGDERRLWSSHERFGSNVGRARLSALERLYGGDGRQARAQLGKQRNRGLRMARYLAKLHETGEPYVARRAVGLAKTTIATWSRLNVDGFYEREAEALGGAEEHLEATLSRIAYQTADLHAALKAIGMKLARIDLRRRRAGLERDEALPAEVEESDSLAAEYHRTWEAFDVFVPRIGIGSGDGAEIVEPVPPGGSEVTQ